MSFSQGILRNVVKSGIAIISLYPVAISNGRRNEIRSVVHVSDGDINIQTSTI